MTIEEINSFLTSSELYQFLFPLKLVFIILSAVMIYLIIYYFFKQKFLLGESKRKFNNLLSSQHFNYQLDLLNQWKEIQELLPKENQVDYKYIVYKACNLFYEVLEILNLSDRDIEELSEKQVPNIYKMQELVKLANDLKEDPTIAVEISKVKELVVYLGQTIDKLKIL